MCWLSNCVKTRSNARGIPVFPSLLTTLTKIYFWIAPFFQQFFHKKWESVHLETFIGIGRNKILNHLIQKKMENHQNPFQNPKRRKKTKKEKSSNSNILKPSKSPKKICRLLQAAFLCFASIDSKDPMPRHHPRPPVAVPDPGARSAPVFRCRGPSCARSCGDASCGRWWLSSLHLPIFSPFSKLQVWQKFAPIFFEKYPAKHEKVAFKTGSCVFVLLTHKVCKKNICWLVPFLSRIQLPSLKINIAPEKAYFQVLLLLVSGSVVYVGSCNYHGLDLKKKQLAKWLLAAWHSEHCYHCP